MPALSKIPKISQICSKYFSSYKVISLTDLQCLSDILINFKQEKPDLEIFLKIRFLPPCLLLSKIPKISQIWSKKFSTYKVISFTDLQCLSDILIISSNKSQIWKYFWKLDFCPHAYSYRKFQKSARFGQKKFQPIKLSPWLIYNAWVIFLSFQATKARFGNISEIRFLPPCRPYRKFQKSARFAQNIFQAIKLSPWLSDTKFLSFQATKARFGNISDNAWDDLPPCRPYRKFQTISQIWSKKVSDLLDFCPHAGSYRLILQCLSDILIISSNKRQIWKYFWKLDFCPHAGPIENSKNQPDLVKKIFKL